MVSNPSIARLFGSSASSDRVSQANRRFDKTRTRRFESARVLKAIRSSFSGDDGFSTFYPFMAVYSLVMSCEC